MKALRNLVGGLLIAGAMTFASCGPIPVKLPEIPLSEVNPYFAEAAEVQPIDTAFYEVKDASGHVLGTVLYSSPFSDAVKGFNGPTPLLIALDANGRVKDVVLLEHQETPRFAQRVESGGLFEAWDGLTVDEALSKEVDAVSGATYTSEGVKHSLSVRLETYQRQLAKDRSAEKQNFWQKLLGK